MAGLLFNTRAHLVAGALVMGLAAGGFGVPTGALALGPDSVADVAAPLLDAVVNISTSQTVAAGKGMPMPQAPEGAPAPFQDFFDEFFNQKGQQDNRPRKVQSLGSGVVIDPAGIIVTNNHVIEGADEITFSFNDGSKLKATVKGRDEKVDIAVLEVKPAKPLTSVKFGDSEALRIGDWVMAIGNPFGLGGTVTVGILSARNRDISSGPYDNFLQTDAAINQGNSGGPLFNMNGELIGINTAIMSRSGGSIGLGFAIPSSMIASVVSQLRDYGEVRRGWIGVRIQDVTDDIAESLSMSAAKGALVAGVVDKGPAALAGILPGDVIIEFDGKPINAMHELPRYVAEEPVGKEVQLKVFRKGKEETVTARIALLEEEKAASAADNPDAETTTPAPVVITSSLGLTLSDLTPDLRTKYGIKDEVTGAVVTDVAGGSVAAEKNIAAGNVITEVGQEKVTTAAEVQAALEKAKAAKRRNILLLVANKDGDLQYVAVDITR
jgi:serine protease Do